VDGHLHRAGFSPEQILESHGSIHFLQCVEGCTDAVWSAGRVEVAVDAATVRARLPLPACPHCARLTRPNILMFNNGGWIPNRCEQQFACYQHWLGRIAGKRLVVIEFRAATAVPMVQCERQRQGGLLVRVNPRDTAAPVGSVAVPAGALQVILAIDHWLN
jgi:NAD-dependent SIR2 family protein deacetylase